MWISRSLLADANSFTPETTGFVILLQCQTCTHLQKKKQATVMTDSLPKKELKAGGVGRSHEGTAIRYNINVCNSGS